MGSTWALVQSVSMKAVSLLSQVILARLLTPEQLGLAGKALGVHGLLIFYTPPIMTDVLVQRKDRLDRDAIPAFWLTMLFSIGTALTIAVSGPFLAWWFPERYGDPLLIGLLAILAIKPIVWAIQVVSLARLRLHFRFKTLSNWSIGSSLLSAAVSIILAALGFGPFAVVLPLILSIVVITIGCERLEPTRPFRNPTLSGWRPLLRDWTVLCLGQYAHTVCLFSDYIILAFFASDGEIGFYYFAFTLSSQLNSVIIYNLSFVLQPVFATIRDDAVRQVGAFLRVCRVLGAVTVPLCILQGVLAEPLIRLVFGERWVPAAPLVLALSVAQMFAFTVGPTAALLKGQDRFGTYLRWQACQALFIVPMLTLGAWLGSRIPGVEHGTALFVALGTLLTYGIFSPIGVWLGIRPGGGRLRDVALAIMPSFVASILAAVPAWFILRWDGLHGVEAFARIASALPSNAGSVEVIGHLIRWMPAGVLLLKLAWAAGLAVPIYLFALRLFDRATFGELAAISGRLLARVRLPR